MNRIFNVMAVFLVLLTPAFLLAADKPRIVNYSANMLDNGLSVNVHWLSRNPVTTVKVIAGGQLKETRIDEYDNRSNPDGFSGEVTLVVPFQRGIGQTSVPFTIQLEDDLRQKSEFSNGAVDLPVSAQPGMQPMHQDDWGRQHGSPAHDSGRAGSQVGGKIDIVDKLLAVADRFDTPPSLDRIAANVIGTESVSFSGKANDDKGLREIVFRVYDNQGNRVNEQTLTNLGKIWQGSTQPVKLPGGSYRVVAQAIDSKGNTSAEKSAAFTMSGPAAQIQPVTTATVQQPSAAASSESAAVPTPAATAAATTEQSPATLLDDPSQQSMPAASIPQTMQSMPTMPVSPGTPSMMPADPAVMQSPAMSPGSMPQQGMMQSPVMPGSGAPQQSGVNTPAMPVDPTAMQPSSAQPPGVLPNGMPTDPAAMPQQGMVQSPAMPTPGVPQQPDVNTVAMPVDPAAMQPSLAQPPAMPPNGMPGSSAAMTPPMPTDPAMMQTATAPPPGMPAMPVDPNGPPVPLPAAMVPASASPQLAAVPVAAAGRGGIRVIILPSEILRDGARWKLQGVTEWSDKENEGTLTPGKYILEFKPVDGYKTPGSRPVEIRDRDTVEMLVTYIKL